MLINKRVANMERRVLEVGRGRWMNPAIAKPTPDFRKRNKSLGTGLWKSMAYELPSKENYLGGNKLASR